MDDQQKEKLGRDLADAVVELRDSLGKLQQADEVARQAKERYEKAMGKIRDLTFAHGVSFPG